MTNESGLPDFASIHEAYRARVLAYATRLIGRDDAEDVAQEVFAKVDRALGTLADPSKMEPWIIAITLNTVRDAARRRAARIPLVSIEPQPTVQDAVPPSADTPDRAARTPEEAAMRNEMVACFLDHLERLPSGQRDVYVLAELEQLSNPEIARRLSLSLATVKIRLHRARLRLHEELRRSCQTFQTEGGELMGEPKTGD